MVRQRRNTGDRSKPYNMLIAGRFGAFARIREMPKRCLLQGNSRTARNRLDFVLAANRLYGACIRGARAPASLKQLLKVETDALDPLRIRGARAPASLKLGDCGRSHGNRHRIRGARAPASLKHSVDWCVDEVIPISIRGARAPASLKLGNTAASALIEDKHPGRARPGLIEAHASGDHGVALAEGIRGARAPASLKPSGIA